VEKIPLPPPNNFWGKAPSEIFKSPKEIIKTPKFPGVLNKGFGKVY